jgi:hypothetical protein
MVFKLSEACRIYVFILRFLRGIAKRLRVTVQYINGATLLQMFMRLYTINQRVMGPLTNIGYLKRVANNI